MSSSVPKIITCTENKDLDGVKSCIENGDNIDAQRPVLSDCLGIMS